MNQVQNKRRRKRAPKKYFKKMIKGYLRGYVTSDTILKNAQRIKNCLSDDIETMQVLNGLEKIHFSNVKMA